MSKRQALLFSNMKFPYERVGWHFSGLDTESAKHERGFNRRFGILFVRRQSKFGLSEVLLPRWVKLFPPSYDSNNDEQDLQFQLKAQQRPNPYYTCLSDISSPSIARRLQSGTRECFLS